MFKRANKITALLVAAAAVVSIVPATAANASDRLGTKDGTITNAVAYQDGKYVYQGYKSDDSDESVYYNAGDKDKALDGLDSADLENVVTGSTTTNASYSDKYAYAKDGSDEYLVDLSNGDVIDDQTPEDDSDNAATKLRSALKKTDRYGDGTEVAALTSDDLTTLSGDKFGDVWYQYAATSYDSDAASNLVDGKLYGFTNQAGKYIDASNIANIYAYSSAKGKVVKIDEFSNSTDDIDDDTKLLATLVAAPEVLAQDKDYIYAKVTVQIYDENAATGDITGTTTSAAAVAGIDASKVVTRTYIQKIAKAQGDKKDDAYLPKTVQAYEITKDELDSGDANDAYDAINDSDTTFTAVNGQLLAIKNTSENVKVTTINLKKDKVKFDTTAPTSLPTDDTKVDVYLAEKDSDDDVDIDADTAVDTDIDGNVWAVGNGKIYEFSNNEFNTIYTVDNSLDSLSVYDKSSLITWNQDEEIYTTVNEGTAETAGEATPAQTGWVNTASGWTFYDAAGKQVVGSWVNAGGVWYMMKADGVMATGWYNDNGTWYFLNASGAMQTGWTNANGTWYFLKSSGAMATGWLNDNGTWYYLNSNGSMAANTTVDGYTLGASGAWIQ